MRARSVLPCLLLPFCLLLAAGASRGQGEAEAGQKPEVSERERKIDAVKEFERFFRKYPKLEQKVEAVLTLETADCPEAVEALLPLLRAREPEISGAAKKVLIGFRSPDTFDNIFAQLVEMKDRDMRADLIEVVSSAGQTKLLGTLREIWTADAKSLAATERYAIARAVGRLGGQGCADILGELAVDRAWEVRVAAVDAIRLNKLKDLGPALVPLLDDAVWQVQAATIKCFGELRTREGVEPLIEFLRKPGRLKEDAAEALFLVTTRDFGTDYEQWKKQWAFLTSIPDFRLPTDEELAKAKEARAKANKLYRPEDGKKAFAGIPTLSTRVIFIIDISASMDDLVVDREKFKAGDYPSFRKIDIVKTELLRTINTLDKNTQFNILAFARDVKDWKNFLTAATINYKASAISWVKRLEPLGTANPNTVAAIDDSGKTNTYAALMRAFDLDPGKGMVVTGKGDASAPKLDTIYFLTDGRPSIGKYVDTDDILREVRKINEIRGVVIHAISIGEFEASFMERLAVENGGVFVNLGG